MAQIRIEQKRSSLGWLWVIIALIIIGVIIWYLLGRGTAATETTNTTSPATTPSSQVVPAQDAASSRLAAA
jgi:ABC-type polysaccharide/polyol phosphate export permease